MRISEWREAARLILACPSCFAATLGEQLGPQVLASVGALRGRALRDQSLSRAPLQYSPPLRRRSSCLISVSFFHG